MLAHLKPIAQRGREQAGPGRGPDQRERPQRHVDRAGVDPFAQQDVDAKILHRRIEKFLDRLGQPMDLVDEQHRAFFGVGQIGNQILGGGSAAPLAICKLTPRSRGMQVAKVVLPRPGGPSNRICPSVSPRFLGGIDRDFQPRVDLALADHVAHPLRAQVAVVLGLVRRWVEELVRARK